MFWGARFLAFGMLIGMVAGCEQILNRPRGLGEASNPNTTTQNTPAVEIVERDVEAPEIFQMSDQAAWDGRPSFGGVWIAHANTDDPTRVIIRNTRSGQFVVGTLFRKDPGDVSTPFQISSDAAQALGIGVGETELISVTALRRETETPPVFAHSGVRPIEETPPALAPLGVESDGVGNAPETTRAQHPQPPATSPATPTATLPKPYVQIGIFSLRENAQTAVNRLQAQGVSGQIHQVSISNKTFWRVTLGPSNSQNQRDSILTKARAQGFTDAYFVAN